MLREGYRRKRALRGVRRRGRLSFDHYLPQTFRGLAMSYFLPKLPSGWHVDEAIKSEEDRVVVIRFGHDWDPQCMTMDETLYSVAEKVQNFAVIYLCDITQVPDFNKVRAAYADSLSCVEHAQMYELYDPCTVMFFYRCVLLFALSWFGLTSCLCYVQEQTHHDRLGHW
jgi:thiol-disulfide isomerase/thioredoxin